MTFIDGGTVMVRSDSGLNRLGDLGGKRIGLVTTATVYDATPAAFALHAASRRDSQVLVDQLLLLEPDVLMGGGAEYFLPTAAGGKRKDGQDVMAGIDTISRPTAAEPVNETS